MEALFSPYIVPGLIERKPLLQNVCPSVMHIMEVSGFSHETLSGPCRKMETTEVRMVCMYLLRNNGWKLKRIGDFFKRDHTTVINAIRTINDRIWAKDYNIMTLLERAQKFQ